ncbi:hypothetical protein DFA_08885 [Cavenderia fasciculata]|uniref:Ankyrin repeat-containing protein n=1 Tax=Cavenderia fasciculata TaxID=261658 RepID=F4Q4T8_CACFS|nr:uncharacterized protein DFA_08885 [Cavenderia fasciculata]EGG17884.1 hypothetical protein DFA_08885 [Cavenderia fasciculata]|eukprot:XP_004356368.1 hypothetical protein DFA_08885 [Cavenderia fasciculata]
MEVEIDFKRLTNLFKGIIHHQYLKNYLIKSIKEIHQHKFKDEQCTELAKVHTWTEVLTLPNILLKYRYYDLYRDCTNQLLLIGSTNKHQVFWDLLATLDPSTTFPNFLRPYIAEYLDHRKLTINEWKKLFQFVLQMSPFYFQDALQIERNRMERKLKESSLADEMDLDIDDDDDNHRYHDFGSDDDDDDDDEVEVEEEVDEDKDEDESIQSSQVSLDEDALMDIRDDLRLFGELGDLFSTNRSMQMVQQTVKSFNFGNYVGDLEKFVYLEKSGVIFCTTMAMDRAATRGDLEMVKYLQANRTEGCSDEGLGGAIENAHLDVVHFILENQMLRGHGCHNDAFVRASAHGHLKVFEYFHQHYPHDRMWRAATYMNQAAQHGHLSLLKFLHFHRTDFYSLRSEIDLDQTIANCRGDPSKQKSIEQTALFIMEHRQDQLASPSILSTALQRGSMVLVERIWACNRLRDRKSTNSYLLDAVAGRNIDAVRFIHANHPFASTMIRDNAPMVRAARNGDIEILAYLAQHRAQGCVLDALDVQHIKKNKPQTTKFFLVNPSSLSKPSYQLLFDKLSNLILLIKIRCMHIHEKDLIAFQFHEVDKN